MGSLRKALGAAVCALCIMVPKAISSSIDHGVQAKINPILWEKMQKTGSWLPILINMREQADLSGAELIKSKEDKGQFVYDQLTLTAERSQRDLVGWLEAQKLAYQRFYIANMIVLDRASPQQIREIAARKDVLSVSGNPSFKAVDKPTKAMLQNEESKGIEGNLTRIGADKVWNELKVRGEGIVVAGQDTGVEWNHPALINQYRGQQANGQVDHSFSWHDAIHQKFGDSNSSCGYELKVPCDDNGHGTHTTGTMVGSDGGANQIGVAPGAKWIACRNMDNGLGKPSTYIECFEWFLAPYPQGANPFKSGNPAMAPHVINNSWGCPIAEGCSGEEILPILNSLKAAGIMVVASAGNEGSKCKSIGDQPATHSAQTLSVGAFSHKTNTIADFSSRGPSVFDNQIGPDVTAPGVNIRSSVPGAKYSGFMWSGTSMAGPHVVGQVALMWSANKGLIGQIDRTTEIITKTAEPMTTKETCGDVSGESIPNNTFGHGIMNIHRSVTASLTQ